MNSWDPRRQSGVAYPRPPFGNGFWCENRIDWAARSATRSCSGGNGEKNAWSKYSPMSNSALSAKAYDIAIRGRTAVAGGGAAADPAAVPATAPAVVVVGAGRSVIYRYTASHTSHRGNRYTAFHRGEISCACFNSFNHRGNRYTASHTSQERERWRYGDICLCNRYTAYHTSQERVQTMEISRLCNIQVHSISYVTREFRRLKNETKGWLRR